MRIRLAVQEAPCNGRMVLAPIRSRYGMKMHLTLQPLRHGAQHQIDRQGRAGGIAAELDDQAFPVCAHAAVQIGEVATEQRGRDQREPPKSPRARGRR